MRRPSRGIAEAQLPLIEASSLWHIGTLDEGRRGERGKSLEGNLFSVSACPEAWRKIARLGGASLYKSGRPVLLLDMVRALDAPEFQPLRDLATAYGIEQGLLAQGVVYKAIRFDDELDSEIYSMHESRELAECESDEVEEVALLLATDKLKQIHSLPQGVTPGLEYAMIEWLRERVPVLPTQDQAPIAGVYWDEGYDPENYSAPRGGLFSPAFAAFEETNNWPSDRMRLSAIRSAESIDIEQLPGKQTLTLYHGTNAHFDSFSLEHSATGTGTSVGRLGIWLAPSPSDAACFGSTVLTVEAEWRRPYMLRIDQISRMHTDSGKADDVDRFFDEQRQRLLAMGYDSIAVLESNGQARSVIALGPGSLRIAERCAAEPLAMEP